MKFEIKLEIKVEIKLELKLEVKLEIKNKNKNKQNTYAFTRVVLWRLRGVVCVKCCARGVGWCAEGTEEPDA